jgi:hypothetical protein
MVAFFALTLSGMVAFFCPLAMGGKKVSGATGATSSSAEGAVGMVSGKAGLACSSMD